MDEEKEKLESTINPGGTPKDSLSWYKNEVKHLKGKIQGYQALSTLLHESKQEIRNLKHRNQELLNRMDGMLMSGPISQIGPPSSSLDIVTKPQAINSPADDLRMELDAERGSFSDHLSVAAENSELGDMEIVNQDAIEMTGDVRMMSGITASLEIDPYDLQPAMEGTNLGGISKNPQDPFSLQHLTCSSIPTNPNPSNDRPVRISTSNSNGEMSSSIVLISPEDRGNLVPLIIPSPPDPPGPLANQVAYISQVLTRNVGLDEPSDISNAMARLSIEVLKVEKELRMKQALINNLCPENEKLKAKFEKTIQAREESIQHLRKEKNELQLKLSELAQFHVSPETLVTSPEWVHVQNPDSSQKLTERFDEQTRRLESLHGVEVQQLQVHVEAYRNKLKEAEAAACRSQADSQKLLKMTNDRAQEETKSKEVAMAHFHSEQERCRQYEAKLIAEQRRADMSADRITALENQLVIFQGSQSANNFSRHESMNSLVALTNDELRTKVHLLQQQVSIYKEDFDRERNDRERIQADKDAVGNGLKRYKADLIVSQRKIRDLERERELLKSENTCLRHEFQQIRQCEQDVVRLQTENMLFREQLQQKIDEIRHMTSMPLAVQAKTIPTDTVTTDKTWRCSSCTFDNPGVRSSCEVCGRSRNRSGHNAFPSQAGRLIPHGSGVPIFGRTECDSTTPNRITKGDDLIIDGGEDVTDKT